MFIDDQYNEFIVDDFFGGEIKINLPRIAAYRIWD